jgi:Concanavalin A-like lectin/glucanases superfamily
MYGIGGSWCLPFMGFDNTNHFVVQTWSTSGVQYFLLNSAILSLNTWTHIAMTYSNTNGLLLYVNGTMMNTIGLNLEYKASDGINAITIGTGLNQSTCAAATTQISSSQFNGKIDELRVYARELSSGEILNMANP